MLKSHKILLAAFVVVAVAAGAAGTKEAEAGITIACGPHGCVQTTTVYRPPVYVHQTPVYSPTYYVRYFDASCGQVMTRWYTNRYDAVAACNHLRYYGIAYRWWIQ